MTKQVQRRRGTATQHTSFTGAEGELSVNTTNKTVHVHDGVTTGGIESARADLDNVSAADILSATGITASVAELNRVDGVTSPIQTQLNAKAPIASPTFTGTVTVPTADINGGTIDGTVIGGTTPAAGSFTQANFGDNGKAIFGAGSDLQIYHDGSHSYIQDVGTGDLNVKANNLLLQSATSENYISAYNNGPVNLYHNNSLKMNTTSTGVDVTGTITSDGLTVATTSAVTASFARDGSDGDAVQIFNGAVGTTKSLGLGVDGTHGTINSQFGGVKIQPSGTTSAFFSTGGDVSFYDDLGVTPKFFWDSSAESLGIATSSPQNTLHLFRASADIYSEATGNAASVGNSIFIDNTNNTLGTFGQIVFRNGSSGQIFNRIVSVRDASGQGSLRFVTGSSSAASEKLTITSAGSVGIGNTAPATALDVTGTITADGLTVDGNVALENADNITFKDTGGANRGILTFDASNDIIIGPAGAGIQDIKFKNNGAKTRLNIDVGGDVSFYDDLGVTPKFFWDSSAESLGIGTSSPSSKLHVNSGIYDTIAIFETTDRYGVLKLRDSTSTASTGGVTFGVDGDKLYVQTGSVNSNALNIDASGNVGINVSIPSATLDVAGDVTLRQDGTTTTGERRLAVRSLGYAILELSGDRGNTSGESGGAGMIVSVDGISPNGVVSFVNAAGTDGVGGSYTGTDNNTLLVGTTGNQPLMLGQNSTAKLVLGGSYFRPAIDVDLNLGHPTYRWNTVYASSGSINTSDATTKQDIEVISEAETRVALACKGLMRKFRFIDAVDKKGDDARIHFGIIAQDLQAAFVAEGLDPNRYAMFCSDTWWEEDIVIPARDAVDAVLDDEGNVVKEGREAVPETTQRKFYETAEEATETATEVTRLGVRYSDLLAFIIGAM